MTDVRTNVRDRYARHAVELPQTETPPTLGLGDAVTLAELKPGESVLDLGSGPGRDLLAAAKAVGPTGRSIGVDFTPEMIERARSAARDAGLENVSILEGDLERLPVPCGAVDVVISNCVINLVPDKRRALIEAFRALRPGGRLAILDTAFATEPGPEVRNDPEAWCGCIAGSLLETEYVQTLEDIGFEDVKLRRIGDGCGDANTVQSLAVAVTASKPAGAHPGTDLRPAVPADRERIEALLEAEELAADGLRTEDALVAVVDGDIAGAVALERHGASSTLRSLVVAPEHRSKRIGFRLTAGALEVARWSGAASVELERPHEYFERFGFSSAVRLNFEDADLPALGKPSKKELPTFQNNSCC
jgi:SAM-dependent methyltransferase